MGPLKATFEIFDSTELLTSCVSQNKDLKQMAHHRKKVAGHKLDYDCKKRHCTQGTDMVESEKKFADSYKVIQLSH